MKAVANTVKFDIERLIQHLASGPAFLRELLSSIPELMQKVARKPGKWTIHEHAAHLTIVDDVMVPRLVAFRTQEHPAIVPYNPSSVEETGGLLNMNLAERLDSFDASRMRLVDAFSALAPADWDKHAEHPEFIAYTPKIMLRHLIMHDNLHCYRIEELWLTRDERLK